MSVPARVSRVSVAGSGALVTIGGGSARTAISNPEPTAAHLQLLAVQGRVTRHDTDGLRYYLPS